MSELLVVMLGLAPLALGAIQGALIFNAKVVLNNATFEAARSGAVNNGLQAPMRSALAKHLVPLYGGGTDSGTLASSYVKARTDIAAPANPVTSIGSSTRIAILSPSREAFDDFGIDKNGRREIPNEHLRHKARTVGDTSGVNLQDANLLKIRVTYGYRLFVPVINRMIAKTMLWADPDNAQYYTAETPRIPIVATATVRMQSNARLNGNESSPGAGAGGAPAEGGGGAPADGSGDGAGAGDGDGAGGDDNAGSNPGGGSTPGEGGTPPGDGGGAPGGDSMPPDAEGGTGHEDPGPRPGDGSNPDEVAAGNGTTVACSAGDTSSSTTVSSTGVGNPVNVVNGNKYQHEVDFKPLPGSLGLGFERHYNSRGIYQGSLGYNWSHTYDVSVVDTGDKKLKIRQADGRVIVFTRNKSRYVAQLASDGYSRSNEEGVVWHWNNGRTLNFDSSGMLTSIVLPGGETLTLDYDRSRRLLQVRDPGKRTIGFTYYRNGRIKTSVDPAGRETRYRYDLVGNLRQVSYSDGSGRIYHYEDGYDTHNLTGITDALGIRFASYGYDNHDRAILSAHSGDVGKVMLRYKRNKTLVTDSKGNKTTYSVRTVNGIPVVDAVEGAGCLSCDSKAVRYRYNRRFQVTERLQKDGTALIYQYDSQGRIKSVNRKTRDGGKHLIERYAYWKDRNVPYLVSKPSVAPGKMHSYFVSHDDHGNIVQITETGLRPIDLKRYTAIERTTNYVYRDNRLVQVDGPLPGKADSTYYEYSDRGYLVTVRAPENLITQYRDHDAYGRPQTVIDPDGVATHYRYNYQGQPVSIARGSVIHKIAYDMEGRPSEILGPDGTMVRALYDSAGRLERIVDPEGNQIAWSRDTASNVTGVELLAQSGDVLAHQRFEYDDRNRLARSVAADGSARDYFYYESDRIRAIRDEGGHKIAYQYDSLGRVSRILEAITGKSSAITSVGYDNTGRISSTGPENGNSTRILRGDFGHRVIEVHPSHGITLYRYDPAGRLIGKVNEQGNIARYYYDNANRLVGVGGTKDKPGIRYRYEGTRILEVQSGNETTTYYYNEYAVPVRVEKKLLGVTFTTRYEYEPQTGKLSEKTLPDGRVLVYGYGRDSGKLESIRLKKYLWSTAVVDGIRHQPFGGIERFTHGNSITTHRSADGAGRLALLETDGIQKANYRYNKAGKIAEIERNGVQERYEYDLTGQLVEARLGDRTFRYEYDAAGNRLSRTVNGVQQQLAYVESSNRLTGIKTADLKAYRYSRIGAPQAAGGRRYLYTSGSRPRAVFDNDKLVATYVYNGRGQRIAKTSANINQPETTLYLYEQNRIVAEADAQGRVTAQYIYLGVQPVAKLVGNEIFYIHTDHLGTPRAVTDEDKSIVWQADYAPFGRAAVSTGKIVMNLRFPGQYYDAETGTHYNHYRDYDPETGRYITPDPAGLKGGANSYVYAKNDPLHNADVLGLYSTEVHYYMTYFLARVAGIQAEEALTIALAAQYVDDNHQTAPIGVNMLESLPVYHFTINAETDTNRLTRINNPLDRSTQLQNLRDAAVFNSSFALRTFDDNGQVIDQVDPQSGGQVFLTRCDKAVLYGEFLHAFEDSFSHRGRNNDLYGRQFPGHGLDGHNPDYTYGNITVYEEQDVDGNWTLQGTDMWLFNEHRTLRMEQEVWQMLQRDFSEGAGATDGGGDVTPQDTFGNPITWELLAGDGTAAQDAWVLTGNTLNGYPLDSQGWPRDSFGNFLDPITGIIRPDMVATDPEAIQWQRTCDQSAGGTGCQEGGVLQQFNRAKTEQEKIDILNFWLVDHNFEPIPEYDMMAAMNNRYNNWNLHNITVQDDFIGVIIPYTNSQARCRGGSSLNVWCLDGQIQ